MRKLVSLLTCALLFVGLSSMMTSHEKSANEKKSTYSTKKDDGCCYFRFNIVNYASAYVTDVYLFGQCNTNDTYQTNWSGTIMPSTSPYTIYTSVCAVDLNDLNSSSYITLSNYWYGSLEYVDASTGWPFKVEYPNGGTTHNISISPSELPSGCITVNLVVRTDY